MGVPPSLEGASHVRVHEVLRTSDTAGTPGALGTAGNNNKTVSEFKWR